MRCFAGGTWVVYLTMNTHPHSQIESSLLRRFACKVPRFALSGLCPDFCLRKKRTRRVRHKWSDLIGVNQLQKRYQRMIRLGFVYLNLLLWKINPAALQQQENPPEVMFPFGCHYGGITYIFFIPMILRKSIRGCSAKPPRAACPVRFVHIYICTNFQKPLQKGKWRIGLGAGLRSISSRTSSFSFFRINWKSFFIALLPFGINLIFDNHNIALRFFPPQRRKISKRKKHF